MTYHDCLADAAHTAIHADVPAWLLPTVIVNQATLLCGGTLEGDDAMSYG